MNPSTVPDCDPPPRAPAAVPRPLPPGTCDTHVHMFGPHARYPLDPRRNYTPHECSLAQYRQLMQAAGIARAVLVQPSVYGTDNSALLDALEEGGDTLRGVVVPPPDITEAALRAMHALGVRGVRLNLINPQVVDLDATLALCRKVADWGWHLQVFLKLSRGDGAVLRDLVARAPLPVVVDHMGGLTPGTQDRSLHELLAGGRCWVKLSAPYRLSPQGAPYRDLHEQIRGLAAANPEQVLWGSDWPHTEQQHGTPPAALLTELVHDCFPGAAERQRLCVHNPARLYQFPQEPSS
jgi:predicted TIM-barrel fold metal-dependent hydrolase